MLDNNLPPGYIEEDELTDEEFEEVLAECERDEISELLLSDSDDER